MSFTDPLKAPDLVNPAPGATIGRTDQGVDWGGVKNIVAVAAGKIVQIYNGLSGFGNTVIEQLPTGEQIYYAQETAGTSTAVTTGQDVQAGQLIAGGGSGRGGIEVGTWDPNTGFALGHSQGYTEGVATPAGNAFRVRITRSGVTPASSGAQSTPTGQIVQQAAAKYSIPPQILWGVYGMETGYGSDVSTSSAGAMGSFQFIQATAKTYNYPYNNNTDTATFTAQADAAANYLADLFAQTGTWDAALRRYSGGGYGLAQVQNKGASFSSTATSGTYGGTRPGGESSGTQPSTGIDSIFGNYLTLRDAPRTAPPNTKNPWQWFQASFTGNWDNLGAPNQ